MFFGVAEPILHFATPPHGQATAGSGEAALVAMQYSYFHWALHPWAIYAVVGLALAYSTFRKGRRNLISSAFYPLLGDRVDGPIGKAIDILAIFATLFGTATSLGLGALQINGGLNYLWDVPSTVGGDPDHPGYNGALYHLGGHRGAPRDQVPQRDQHGPGRRLASLLAGRGADGVHPQHLYGVARRLR